MELNWNEKKEFETTKPFFEGKKLENNFILDLYCS